MYIFSAQCKLSEAGQKKLQKLRRCATKRPDWFTMMKDIETPKNLKKVVTNDRSAPQLRKMKKRDSVSETSSQTCSNTQIVKESSPMISEWEG